LFLPVLFLPGGAISATTANWQRLSKQPARWGDAFLATAAGAMGGGHPIRRRGRTLGSCSVEHSNSGHTAPSRGGPQQRRVWYGVWGWQGRRKTNEKEKEFDVKGSVDGN